MTEAKQENQRRRRGAGFTLLELIAVMGIIVTLSFVVVGGYSGILRALAKNAGESSLRKMATLCRQHACIDGSRTYFWVTGIDTYVLCRKAGTISATSSSDRSGDDRPSYLPSGQYSAWWIMDNFSDLGSSQESFDSASGDVDAATQKALADSIQDGTYKGLLLFDITKGEMAKVKYPPWYDKRGDYWIMGLVGLDGKVSSIPSGAFKKVEGKDTDYGWALYPEQQLPKGYAFVNDGSMYVIDEDTGEFQSGKSFFFEPEGTAGSDDGMMVLKVFEIARGTGPDAESKVEIFTDGKIE